MSSIDFSFAFRIFLMRTLVTESQSTSLFHVLGCNIMENFSASASLAAEEIRKPNRCSVLLAGGVGYEKARTVANDAVDHRPALIARCGSTADVQNVVRVARAHELPLSVNRGG